MLIIILVTWGTLLINNPYIMASLFGLVLIFITIIIGYSWKFLGFIFFLVYVGGIMILIRYCVILVPFNLFRNIPLIWFILATAYCDLVIRPVEGSLVFGLLYSASVICLIALLLFLVLLAIVEIIDYSRGMFKAYVPNLFVCLGYDMY